MLIISLATSVAVFAQGSGRMISGTVTDAQGSPLPGVNVVIQGTLKGTISNADGTYQIEASPSDVLEFSFVGYAAQSVTVGNQSVINVALEEFVQGMDEVVVIGYGVQRKSVVTAAISSVDAETLERSSLGRVEHAIQGKSAGISVLPVSGSPGAGVKVRIRGTGSNGKSDPLYIVDGMKTGSINDINPNDIASMEILKDAASAAIYGTEGANGVVLITTKSGSKGAAKVNYDFSYGIQNLSTNMELMNAAQYKQFMTEAGLTINNNEGYDTDWLDEISQSAPMQRHNLSVSGGGEKTTYMVAGSYLYQEGAIGGSNAGFERYTFRVNTKSDVKSWLEVGNNLNFSHSSRNMLPEDDEYRSVVNSALLMDPFTPVFEKGVTPAIQDELDKGTIFLKNKKGQYYALNRFVSGETANPVAFMENTHNKELVDKLLASFYGTIKPFEGFSFTSRVGLELNYVTRKSWSPKYYFSVERSNQINIVEDWIDKYSNVLWENFASYNTSVKDHEFTVLAGMSFEDYKHPNYYLKSQMPKEGDAFAKVENFGLNAGWGANVPTGKIGDLLYADDGVARRQASVISEDDFIAGGGEVDRSVADFHWANYENYIRLKFSTYASETGAPVPEVNYSTPFKIIRYADVLLMAAEAYNKDNQDDKAVPLIKQVRERAGATDHSSWENLTGTDLFNVIVKERQLELAFEGHRFWDLVRWGLADQEIPGFVKGKHELFPIPLTEINLNSAIDLSDQNPGY
jgi:TonB-linked SusC/RagA family outer membrane protein